MTWGHHPRGSVTWEQEPEAQLSCAACHLCFIGEVEVLGFKSLQEDGVW